MGKMSKIALSLLMVFLTILLVLELTGLNITAKVGGEFLPSEDIEETPFAISDFSAALVIFLVIIFVIWIGIRKKEKV